MQRSPAGKVTIHETCNRSNAALYSSVATEENLLTEKGRDWDCVTRRLERRSAGDLAPATDMHLPCKFLLRSERCSDALVLVNRSSVGFRSTFIPMQGKGVRIAPPARSWFLYGIAKKREWYSIAILGSGIWRFGIAYDPFKFQS